MGTGRSGANSHAMISVSLKGVLLRGSGLSAQMRWQVLALIIFNVRTPYEEPDKIGTFKKTKSVLLLDCNVEEIAPLVEIQLSPGGFLLSGNRFKTERLAHPRCRHPQRFSPTFIVGMPPSLAAA
jgi:hypothetical protein